MTASHETLAREARLALPTAIAAVAAVVLIYAVPTLVINQIVGGDTDADFLRAVDSDSGLFTVAMISRALGYLLLLAPLVYLFKALVARSENARSQLIGVVYAAPIFIAISTVLVTFATLDAASNFVALGVEGSDTEANDAARELINEGTLRSVAGGFGIAGQLGFAFAVAYTAFQSMKIGLLTRFWGSLGAALGVASFLFPVFTLLWFVYLGLLIAGWVPRGRPPAWPEGRAIPWPTPGIEVESDDDESDLPPPPPPNDRDRADANKGDIDPPEWDESELGEPSEPPRKRKRRN